MPTWGIAKQYSKKDRRVVAYWLVEENGKERWRVSHKEAEMLRSNGCFAFGFINYGYPKK